MIDFSKSDKKAARAIFELALQREFSKGLSDIYTILQQWETLKPGDNRDTYYSVFDSITKFDKHIARRYDGLTGGKYFATILNLLADGTISIDELGGFSEQAKQKILEYFRKFNDLSD